MSSTSQFAEKNTIYGYEQRSKHATRKGLVTLVTKEEAELTDFTNLEHEILNFKSEREFVDTEDIPTLTTKYISMAEKYDTMMIKLQKYIEERNRRLDELETKNKQLEEQDEYNQGELENYINELDDNEKTMEVMKEEYSKMINDISEVNTNIQSTNNHNYNIMESRHRQLELYMVIITIYSYIIGSYGLWPIVTYHFTFIVYYPVTILFFVLKMLMNAVII